MLRELQGFQRHGSAITRGASASGAAASFAFPDAAPVPPAAPLRIEFGIAGVRHRGREDVQSARIHALTGPRAEAAVQVAGIAFRELLDGGDPHIVKVLQKPGTNTGQVRQFSSISAACVWRQIP